ncbi:MAG: ribosome maturation factor RimP [Clostridia bacterium]|nr:ribosome maturation factor RimP [Clostridia bacterium]
MKRMAVADVVRPLVQPITDENGLILWDVEFVKEGSEWFLRVYIDRENGGIGIEDCERVHRAIEPLIDERDPIENFYYLEVSSPGLERELRTEEHILQSVGETVEAKLFTKLDGQKSVIGKLIGFSDGQVAISEDGQERKIPLSEISKLTTVFFE